MNHNYQFNNVNDALPVLLSDLMLYGDEVASRAGRTKEMTHVGITLLQPLQREVLLPNRKANIAAQIAETMWVLAGRNDVEWLARYLPRAPDFSDDGKTWRAGYGPRLRGSWAGVDQLEYVVKILREHSLTRQAVISLWDPEIDTQPGKDTACNNWLTFTNRFGYLDLHVGIRSNDVVWGWSGINVFEWSVLLEVVASLVGVAPGKLHFSTTSLHIYDQHWERARNIHDGYLIHHPSPRFGSYVNTSIVQFDEMLGAWFILEDQIRTGTHDPRDIDNFPDPMLRSWLRVIDWYWSGDKKALEDIVDTNLWAAALLWRPDSKVPYAPPVVEEVKPEIGFIEFVDTLHCAKHADYGDSWKKRGEPGILANIARKVDRLGKNSDHESALDTAIDLLVYLCKYRWWLVDEGRLPLPCEFPSSGKTAAYSDYTEPMRTLMEVVSKTASTYLDAPQKELVIQSLFHSLEHAPDDSAREVLLDNMLIEAYSLAELLWVKR